MVANIVPEDGVPGSRTRLKATCLECGKETNHELIGHHYRPIGNEHTSGDENFSILECQGCNDISFSYDFHEHGEVNRYGEPIFRTKQFSPTASKRQPMADAQSFPKAVRITYHSTLKAGNATALLAAAEALRATLEAVCVEAQCKKYSLMDKINELVSQGLLSQGQADFLHHIRFLGNDAAHKFYEPSLDEYETALNILEATLTTMYVLPRLAKRLEDDRSERKPTPVKP